MMCGQMLNGEQNTLWRAIFSEPTAPFGIYTHKGETHNMQRKEMERERAGIHLICNNKNRNKKL